MSSMDWNEDESMLGDYPLFVGKDGEPISRKEAEDAILSPKRKRIGSDVVHGHHVSTIWLVMNHGFGDEVPIPFETMIFPRHDGDCVLAGYMERYPTEAAARAGHERAMAEARDARCGA